MIVKKYIPIDHNILSHPIQSRPIFQTNFTLPSHSYIFFTPVSSKREQYHIISILNILRRRSSLLISPLFVPHAHSTCGAKGK